jgi:hypothetical protein
LRVSARLLGGFGEFDRAAGLVSHPVNLLFWQEERHTVLAADEGFGNRHNRAAVTEEPDPQIGAGQPDSLLK